MVIFIAKSAVNLRAPVGGDKGGAIDGGNAALLVCLNIDDVWFECVVHGGHLL